MELLILGQRELHGNISRAYENLKKLGASNITQSAVEARLQALEAKWAKFERQDQTLRAAHGKDLLKSEYLVNDFPGTVEETYLKRRAAFLDLARRLKVKSIELSSTRNDSNPPRTTFPRIQLPHFNRKYEEWPSFRDLFDHRAGYVHLRCG